MLKKKKYLIKQIDDLKKEVHKDCIKYSSHLDLVKKNNAFLLLLFQIDAILKERS